MCCFDVLCTIRFCGTSKEQGMRAGWTVIHRVKSTQRTANLVIHTSVGSFPLAKVVYTRTRQLGAVWTVIIMVRSIHMAAPIVMPGRSGIHNCSDLLDDSIEKFRERSPTAHLLRLKESFNRIFVYEENDITY
jgi:hypothetical protein